MIIHLFAKLFGFNKKEENIVRMENTNGLSSNQKIEYDSIKENAEKIVSSINQSFSKISNLSDIEDKINLILGMQQTLLTLEEKMKNSSIKLNITKFSSYIDNLDDRVKNYYIGEGNKEKLIEECVDILANIVSEINKKFDL